MGRPPRPRQGRVAAEPRHQDQVRATSLSPGWLGLASGSTLALGHAWQPASAVLAWRSDSGVLAMSGTRNIATIEFFDEQSQDTACVIVRRCGDRVALCVSLRADGDVEAFLGRNEAERLLRALEEALRNNA